MRRWMEDALRFILAGAERPVARIFVVHQLADRLPGVLGEEHVRGWFRMPHSLPERSTIGMPLMRLVLHQFERFGEAFGRGNGDG